MLIAYNMYSINVIIIIITSVLSHQRKPREVGRTGTCSGHWMRVGNSIIQGSP